MSKNKWTLENAILDYNKKKIPNCKNCEFLEQKNRMFATSTYNFKFCKVKKINISKGLKALICKYYIKEVNNFPVE